MAVQIAMEANAHNTRLRFVNAFSMVGAASGMVQMYLACMEDVFRNPEVLALKGRMKQGNRVVITAHRSPDGDAIGSSLAMKHLLAHLDVDAQVIMPDAYAKFLQWLPGHDEVWFHERSPEACEQAGFELLEVRNSTPSHVSIICRKPAGK